MCSSAVELLLLEMQNPQTTDNGKIPEFIYRRCSESSDSGMEDGTASPASSISSGSSEIRGISVFNLESSVDGNSSLSKPTFITPSESSAFSKIDRKIIPQIPFPNLTSISQFCPPHGIGYFPGICLSNWNWESSLQGGTPLSVPRVLPDSYETPTAESDESEKPDIIDKNAYCYVDTKIPFTNYFMNLTKIFRRDSVSKFQKNENMDNGKGTDVPNKEIHDDKASNMIHKNQINEKTEEYIYSKHRFMADVKLSDTPENLTISQRVYNSPGSLSIPNPMISTVPPPPLLQFMNNVNTPPSMLHPAFLQMNGVGVKRLPSDKPPPVKKYKCDVCGKAFSRSNTLVTHKRIHTGDKPFKCESCGRAFRQPGNLTRHRLTHTTVKPYVCPHCNKAFNRASNLNTHMRTHTNYKPFMCPYCGKGFHQKIDMKIHCYTHTSRLPTQQMN